MFLFILQGSDAVSLLKERLRAQLVHVAAAYKRCLLFLEGSAAFELSVISSVDELIALGRRCDLALSIITATSPTALEVSYLPSPCIWHTFGHDCPILSASQLNTHTSHCLHLRKV